MIFIPAFSEPQSHRPRAPAQPALGQCGGEGRTAGVDPRGNPTISPHPGRISPHPWFRNRSIYLKLRQPGDENGDPADRNRPARCGTPNPTGQSRIGWGLENKASATRGRQGPILGSEIPPHIFNSDNSGD